MRQKNKTMDMTIELRDVEIYARHGCYREEQLVGGRFVVDADLVVDGARPSATDDVRAAVNYVAVCRLIDEEMARPHHLLESLVANLAQALTARFGPEGLKGGWIRVRKMAPPIGMQVESVGVRLDF